MVERYCLAQQHLLTTTFTGQPETQLRKEKYKQGWMIKRYEFPKGLRAIGRPRQLCAPVSGDR
jgi:glutamate/tyrosine decarboxylase-like PLP-dependent enzyme